MATPINRQHAANLVAKTIRWVEALDATDALSVPAALIALERTGEVGARLAEDGWDRLADVVCEHSGRGHETAPNSTRWAIASQCQGMLALRGATPEERDAALAGLSI